MKIIEVTVRIDTSENQYCLSIADFTIDDGGIRCSSGDKVPAAAFRLAADIHRLVEEARHA